MELAISSYGWLGLFVLLFAGTFGLSGGFYLVIYLAAFIIGAFIALYQNSRRKLIENADKHKLPMPKNPIGIPDMVNKLIEGTKPRKLDRRLTGSVTIDEVLQEISFYIFRDYVTSWYRKISEDDEFPHELRLLVQRVIVAISERTKQVDWVPYFTTDLVDDFASHLRLYRRSCEKIAKSKQKEEEPPDLVTQFFLLEKDMEHQMSRKNICTSPQHEKQYLQDLSEVLLFLLLPPDDFNNKPFRYILREVLVNALLLPVIELVSEPDYVNQNLAWLCRDVPLTAENFLAVVNMSDSIDEMNSIQQKIDAEIARLRSKDTGGEHDANIKAQLSSLFHVKETCQRRINRLQDGWVDLEVEEELDLAKLIVPGQKLIEVPFDMVLGNNLALDAFMEFLGTIGAQGYLSFYLLADGFRATVEQLLASDSNRNHREGGILEELKSMAMNIHSQYLAESSPQRIKLEPYIIRKITESIEAGAISITLFDEAQTRVKEILKEETHFQAFRKSSFYVKMLVELDLFEDGTRMRKSSLQPNSLSPDSESLLSNGGDSVGSGGSDDILLTERTPEIKYSVVATISQTGISRDDSGRKEFALYEITVTKTNFDGTATVWKVLRRYSDFHDLHQSVKDKFGDLSMLNFPSKKTFNNMNKEFLERRRKELDNYLQTLLYPSLLKKHRGLLELVAQFLDVYWERERSTLARTMETIVNPFKNSVKTVGNAVLSAPENLFDGMVKVSDGIIRLPGNVVDGFGKMFNLNTDNEVACAVMDQYKVGAVLGNEDDDNIPMRIMLLLMDEVFDMRNKNTWLRRRIVAILRQIIKATFGDMINRRIVEHVQWLMYPDQVAMYARAFRDAMWPCGVLAAPRPERDFNTKTRQRVVCKAKLVGYVSDEIKTLIGAETSRVGCIRVFNMFQHKTLNKRLAYVILEGFLITLFPDNKFQEVFRKIHEIDDKKKY